jgi:hypothetical protein
MTTGRSASPFEPGPAGRGEFARLVGQIQTLTLDLQHHGCAGWRRRKLDAKERTRERLRRQLAAAAQRAATDELGNAA